ncbi:gliding motility-associated C-terminal domain-containing protein [Ferruginibacter albus]|uniref:gliding motility-associated C-terminal domain-containing protein n=1 Tax=Ferruginibacter albus TaxID=2875540 RepID=UPI001CC6EEAA|nr:gliding motility-associated C-terminal domain-containing protein [Ferruginibacter albus]UAY52643.1 gliding motility-associated C-terminal domain-containing protein [Ferruginibacter albus]
MNQTSVIKKIFLIGLYLAALSNVTSAQGLATNANVSSVHPNFNSFTTSTMADNNGLNKANSSVNMNPDGIVNYINSPVPTAIEIINKRTANSKYFIDKNDASKFYILQSLNAIHYKKNGQWLTMDKRISPKGNNIYEASYQQEPIGFDLNRKMTYIKTKSAIIYFNNWILNGNINGQETILASADWSDYTIGDDGMYIKNVFPGIDAELHAIIGAVKTNFIVHSNKFPRAQQLIFKDDFQTTVAAKFGNSYSGVDEADYLLNNAAVLHVGKALVYDKKDPNQNKSLAYVIRNSSIGFSIEADYLNTHLNTGDVIIDPLVSSTNSTGSLVGGGSAGSICDNVLQVPTPAAATITAISYSFSVHVNVGTGIDENTSVSSGGCTTGPLSCCTTCPNGNNCYNNGVSVGTYSSGAIGFTALNFLSCMPAPSCTSQNVPFIVRYWSTISSNGCDNSYVSPDNPFIIKIEGHTVELQGIGSSAATICNGQSVTLFSSGIYGVPPYTYTWDNNGGNQNSVIVSPNATTTYSVTITDQCNNTATGQVTTNVNPVPSITSVSSNMPVCSGDQLQLSASSSVPNSFYNWVGPNGFNSDQQDPFINNIFLAASGDYTVIATSNGCSSAPGKTSVIIKPTPVITSATSNTPLCADENGVTLILNAQSSLPNSSYEWTGPNGYTNNSQSPSILNANVNESGNYSIAATLNGCTSVKQDVNVIIRPIPKITTAGSNSPICDTKDIDFFATSSLTGTSFSWSGANNFSSDIASPVIANASINNAKGNYFITATKDGCVSKTDTVNVIINPNPEVLFSVPYVCKGIQGSYVSASTIADGTSAAFKYLWSFDDNTSDTAFGTSKHTYSTAGVHNTALQITSNNGCISSLSQPLIISDYPDVQLTFDPAVCSNSIVEIQNNSTLNYGLISKFIFWKNDMVNKDSVIDDNPLDSEQYSFSYPVFGSPSLKDYTIKARVYSDAGCYSDKLYPIQSLASPRLVFNRVPLLCSAHAGNYFFDYAVDSSSLFGKGYYSGDGIEYSNQMNAAVAGVGDHLIKYTYTLSDGCTDSVQRNVTIGAPSIVNAGNEVTILTEGTAFLRADVSGGSSWTYLWTPATGLSNDTIANPLAITNDDTRYMVTVTNEFSCVSAAYVRVKVTDRLFIPNAFTPNGDGINDTWQIDYLKSYPDCDVSVFNRYGQLIYRSTGYNTPWDGKCRGTDIPVGVYYYIINTKRKKGIVSGSLTILR